MDIAWPVSAHFAQGQAAKFISLGGHMVCLPELLWDWSHPSTCEMAMEAKDPISDMAEPLNSCFSQP